MFPFINEFHPMIRDNLEYLVENSMDSLRTCHPNRLALRSQIYQQLSHRIHFVYNKVFPGKEHVFLATDYMSTFLVVKFARTYGLATHLLFHDFGFALNIYGIEVVFEAII